MEEYIAFDSHKRYTWVEHEEVATGKVEQYRLNHAPGAIRNALAHCAPGTPVAIEATANWYWIIDEIEQAQLEPRLVHPRKAKLMMGQINKTGQARYAGDEPFATERNAADGVDTARPLARAARVDAYSFGAGGAAHTLEESHYGDAGEVGLAAE